jgi:hypothetical protein
MIANLHHGLAVKGFGDSSVEEDKPYEEKN